LEPGEQKKVIFELALHLVPGIYHLTAYIHRYDIDKQYDECQHAATFHVRSDIDVRGVANLYPKATVG
jgi:hypothetical protein